MLRKVTILILGLALLSGCSKQYAAEKDFYRASRYSADIFKDPKIIPPYKFEKALEDFTAIIDKYPGTPQAIEAHFIAGNICMLQHKYPEASVFFRKIKKDYPAQVELQARATISLAACLEQENNWPEAYRNYREAVEKYPEVPAILQVPIYLLDHYIKGGDKTKEEQVYHLAVRDYQVVISKYPKTKSAYSARNMLAEVYMRHGDWADVLVTLNELLKQYPQSPDAPTWLMTMAATYETKLHNNGKAREYYQLLKDKYSGSPWAREAGKRLVSLEVPK